MELSLSKFNVLGFNNSSAFEEEYGGFELRDKPITTVEDLFGENDGEIVFNKHASKILDPLYQEGVKKWRSGFNDPEIEEYESTIIEEALSFKSAGRSSTASELQVDMDEVESLYEEACSEIDEVPQDNRKDVAAKGFYKVTEGLERAIRSSTHEELEDIRLVKEDEEEQEIVGHTINTSTPGIMYEVVNQLEDDEMPYGHSLGVAGAVVDGIHDYHEAYQKAKKQAGNTLEQQMERGDPDIEAVTGFTEYEKDLLREAPTDWEDIRSDYDLAHEI